MRKGNLLVVDDEPAIVEMIQMQMGDFADEIFTASDGIEALEVLKGQEVHCVICDISMPKMDGIEVIKNIRLNKNDVPFIFYTGHGDHELMLEVAKYGAFDFLNKPNLDGLEDVTIRGLKEGVSRLVEKEKPSEDENISEYKKMLDELE